MYRYERVLKCRSLLLAALVLAVLSVGWAVADPELPSGSFIGGVRESGMKLQVKGLPEGVAFVRQMENQTWIGYQDGRNEYRFNRPDGTVREVRETYPNLQVTREKRFYAGDGKTIIRLELYSTAEVLQRVQNNLPDGRKHVQVFWADGRRVFGEGYLAADGKNQITFYRVDGKAVLLKLESDGKGNENVLEYDDQGKLKSEVQLSTGGNGTITVYQPGGVKVAYRQVLRSQQLKEVLEYQADGKTLSRKLLLDAAGKVDTVEYFKSGARTQVNTLNADQTIRQEEHFDAAGKVIKVTTYSGGPGVKEKLDPKCLQPQLPADPYVYFQKNNK